MLPDSGRALGPPGAQLNPIPARSTSRARACRTHSRPKRRCRPPCVPGARSARGRARTAAGRSSSRPRGRGSCRRARPRARGTRERAREPPATSICRDLQLRRLRIEPVLGGDAPEPLAALLQRAVARREVRRRQEEAPFPPSKAASRCQTCARSQPLESARESFESHRPSERWSRGGSPCARETKLQPAPWPTTSAARDPRGPS